MKKLISQNQSTLFIIVGIVWLFSAVIGDDINYGDINEETLISMDWITITILATISGCAYKTSDPKQRMGGIVLIILILFMNYFLK